MNVRLTCWPFDAIGVDLNSQNQEKGAGVHRVDVLVHFKWAEEIISCTWCDPAAQAERSPSSSPNSDWVEFRRHWRRQGSASSANWRQGKHFRGEISFSSPLSVPASTSPSADWEYEPGASKWPNLPMALWCSNVGQADPPTPTLCECARPCLYICENLLDGNPLFMATVDTFALPQSDICMWKTQILRRAALRSPGNRKGSDDEIPFIYLTLIRGSLIFATQWLQTQVQESDNSAHGLRSSPLINPPKRPLSWDLEVNTLI